VPPPAPPDRLDTPRLRLRRWCGDDRVPFAAMNADAEVMRFFPSTLTREASDALADRIEAGFDHDGYGLWAVEVRDPADRDRVGCFAGFVGLSHPPILGERQITEPEIGWRLARWAWGRGYATEAAEAARADGVTRGGLRALVSLTAAVNTPSRRVMEKLGFSHDPAEDLEHPALAPGSPLRHHVLYRWRTDA
jgi:RimJ/RimL family protein N-acetyltransferase